MKLPKWTILEIEDFALVFSIFQKSNITAINHVQDTTLVVIFPALDPVDEDQKTQVARWQLPLVSGISRHLEVGATSRRSI